MPTAVKTSKFAQAASDISIQTAKQALEDHGFKVKVVDNLEQARAEVKAMVPEGSEVFTATSATLDKAGITKDINESGKYVSVRDKFYALAGQPDKAKEMRRAGSVSDYTLGSVHAVTQDGQVMVASASGSQLPNYAFGAGHVIWVVGAQKIVKDLNEAWERLETYTFPLENERAKKAYGQGSSINKVLLYKKETAGRVTIILVKEPVGF